MATDDDKQRKMDELREEFERRARAIEDDVSVEDDEPRKHPWTGRCLCHQDAAGNLRRNPECPIHGKMSGDTIARKDGGGANPPGWRDATSDKTPAARLSDRDLERLGGTGREGA